MFEAKYDNTQWSLPVVVAAQAKSLGDKPFIVSIGEGVLSYAQANEDARRVADYLNGLGIQPGDRVIVMTPNSLDFIRIWIGLGRLGAIMVAMNTGLSGPILESQVLRSKARYAIVGGQCIAPLAEVLHQAPDVGTIVVVGAEAFPGHEARRILPFAGWRGAGLYDGPMPRPQDIACILYTSGTTGPSKGVLMPHAHCYLYGLGMADNTLMTPDDVLYDVLPLYHVNGLFIQVYGGLVSGAAVVIRPKFSASAWLDDVISHGVTLTVVVGAVIPFVLNQPPSPRDRQHKLRLVMPGPNLTEHEKVWRERFGVPEIVSSYGMTECNIPTYEKVGDTRSGSCGKAYGPYFDVRIVDPDTDREMPRNSVGEIVVRPNAASGFMAGYDGMPEKTVEATRNLWFHTGDAGRMDEDGFVFFIDRIKDRIRRRGENVSSYEVEEALERLDAIKEAAVFAVPSDLDDGEDEIMVAAVLVEGQAIGPQDIARFAEQVLPKFCRPRYIEIVDALPRTKTEKVQRNLLRERGLTAGAFDVARAAFVGAGS
ncbi:MULTISPECIES: AMP-binding protein [unclassified Chelatococcus]|uniref:AMP-binding protein n=1 Tax=unclassified Chelatococcus TaxID=2638111 RepID=UPI001BCB2774|nr:MULTISPECIES: AMP-binding protein [unclassified Chelatococcus]MBS7701381.1 AMP-binding protein [Chelatococcus sp. YT9]MBX3557461.1 AMP-binding protein [Chelatococcus sp.]